MLESARNRDVAISKAPSDVPAWAQPAWARPARVLPVQVVLSAGTLLSFAWLLLQNKIHPIVVYLLQVYLTF